MNKSILLLLFCALAAWLQAQQTQTLAGEWRFKLDNNDKGLIENWQNQQLPNHIILPGTTDEAHYGEKTTGSDFGILTRSYKYYGPAWYQRTIEIPSGWKGKRILLQLERVMWESKVFIDGKEVSTQDALNSPHWHDLGILSPGSYQLSIRVNNDLIHNIGDKGHVYTEYTQSIWNGIVGEIQLEAKDPIRFINPQVYTTSNPATIRIKDILLNESTKSEDADITMRLIDRKTGTIAFSKTIKQKLDKGETIFDYTAQLPTDIKLWNDVTPNLYELELELQNKKWYDSYKTEIGFRDISASRSKILVNGKPVFMRGNLDCVHFPLTGYPSCDIEEWERIFRIYKDYGLNHVRFHSWCPPKAAFTAADRIGIYIQAEVIWIDWWMTNTPPDRKDMITKGSPEGLGKNPSADAFVQKELSRMLDAYGNHPSFIMQCIGNELGNSDFDIMESWMKPLKEKDSRRLYAVSTARKIMPLDQYMATHYIQGIGSTRGLKGGASTNWDFEDVYKQAEIPILSHEIGQWPVYPRWSEIKKYKGVLKARNMEEFLVVARKNNLEEQNEAFLQASGALNQIMYKYEIESFFRTPSCAGIQLLSMQDYQGQGEALVGWLDVFYDSKGITTPDKFRSHMDTVVPLLRLPKFVWENNEKLTAEIQLANYGTQALHDGVYWKITDEMNILIGQGQINPRTYPMGSSDIAGKIECNLFRIDRAKKLTIEVGLNNDAISNRWHIWVYPSSQKNEPGKVYITDRMNGETIKRLEKGENVLLQASALGTEATADKISFYPLYWSLTFFPGQGKNTIGMVIQDKHPAFSDFPTDFHSDWQWQSIYKDARAFYINDYPADYRPLAQPVDDFHRNNKLASIFELKVGKGKLLICGFDLTNDSLPVARQLKRSLLHYMQTDNFAPQHEVDIPSLQTMFTYVEPLQSTIPGAFSNSLLYIDSDTKEIQKNTRIKITSNGKDNTKEGPVWQGKEITLTIHCPQGIIGSLYVCFEDKDKKGRTGDIIFEGRNFELGKQKEEENWVKFHVMREDSNDGRIVLKANVKNGSDLIISKIALKEE